MNRLEFPTTMLTVGVHVPSYQSFPRNAVKNNANPSQLRSCACSCCAHAISWHSLVCPAFNSKYVVDAKQQDGRAALTISVEMSGAAVCLRTLQHMKSISANFCSACVKHCTDHTPGGVLASKPAPGTHFGGEVRAQTAQTLYQIWARMCWKVLGITATVVQPARV